MFDRLMSREARVLPRFARLVSKALERLRELAMDGARDEWRLMSREARVLPRFARLVSRAFERSRTMDFGWRAFSEAYLMPRFGNGFNRGFNRFGRDWKQLVARPPAIREPTKRYFRSETFRQWVNMADVTFGNIYFTHSVFNGNIYYSGNSREREVNVDRYFSPDTGNY
jgi:hypothetical protein